MTDAKLNVYQRLLEVQKEAKAPRSIDGKFGKSRSAEQILEAYKPVCNRHGLYLQTTDEIKEVGGRNYIVATAQVINTDEPTEMVSAIANAWEGEIPKNKYDGDIIDSSQLTGKTSSYAKKYALQNLFAIDDTKDSDQNEPEDEKAVLLRAKQKINGTLKEHGYEDKDSKVSFILSVLGKGSIDNLNDADSVMDALEKEDKLNG